MYHDQNSEDWTQRNIWKQPEKDQIEMSMAKHSVKCKMLYKCKELILLMLIMFKFVHLCYAICNFKVRKLIKATSKIEKEKKRKQPEKNNPLPIGLQWFEWLWITQKSWRPEKSGTLKK